MIRMVVGLRAYFTKTRCAVLPALVFLILFSACTVSAGDGTWTNASSGHWSDAGNWVGGTVADGSGSTADFGTLDIATGCAVHLDSPRTIGNVAFGDAVIGTPGGWILDNHSDRNNILTIDGGTPTITVSALGTDMRATISAGLAGYAGLVKSGTGTLKLAGRVIYTGQTKISGGVLTLGAGYQTLLINQPLQVNGESTLDLGSNRQYVGQFSSSSTGEGSAGIVTGAGGTLTVNQQSTTIFGGSIRGTVDLVKAGAQTLSVASGCSATGSIAVISSLSSLRERNNASDLGYGLTLRDGGSLSNAVSFMVRNSTLNLDNNGTRDMSNRVNDTAPITLDNGTLRFIGRAATNSTETVGGVTAMGFSSITMLAGGLANPVAGSRSILTLSSLVRNPGSIIQFNRGGGVNTPLGGPADNLRVYLKNDDISGLKFSSGAIVGMSSYNDNDKYYPVGYVPGLGFGNLGQPGFPKNYMPGSDGNGFSGANTLTNAAATNDFITGALQVVRAGGQTINSLGIQGSGFGSCSIPLTFQGSNDTLTIASGWLAMWFQQTQLGFVTNRGSITSGQSELFMLGGYQGAWGDSGNVNTIHSVIKDNGVIPVKFVMNLGRHTYLTADNTFSGGTTVNGMLARESGTLFPRNLYLNATAPGYLTIPNAASPAEGLVITSANVTMLGYQGQIGSGNIVTLNGGSTLSLLGNNTLAGVVFNSNGGTDTPVVSPDGVLTITGSVSSTPSNPTVTPRINGGIVDLNGAVTDISVASLPDGNFVNGQTALKGLSITSEIRNGGITKRGTGVLDLSGGNTFAGQLTVAAGVLDVGSVNDISAVGVLGQGPLSVILGSTNGVTNVTGTLEYSGGGTSSTKPFTMATGGTGEFQVDAAGSTLVLNGLIDGEGGLSKTGDGILVLGANNSYSGGTCISGGTLCISSDANLGGVPGSFQSANITINNSGTLSLTADIALAGTRGIVLGSSGIQVISAVGGSSDPVLGEISGSGSVDFVGVSDEFRLGRANVYTGETRVYGTAKLTPGGENAFQFSTVSDSTGNSIFLYGAAGSATFGGISGSFGLPLESATGAYPVALYVGNNNQDTAYTGVLSGGGSLTKIGTGTLELWGNSTYTGATMVATGTLVGVTGGSCSNSAVTVADGATNGVRILAEDGQWTCAALNYGAGTAFVAFAFSVVPSFVTSPLKVNGDLTFAGTTRVCLVAPEIVIPVGIYPLISYSGVLSGTPPTNAFALPSGLTAFITNNVGNKSIDLNVTVGNEIRWRVGDGAWDIYTSDNWNDTSFMPAKYVDGAAARFDDSASGGGPVGISLDVFVSPGCVTVSNVTRNYAISGSGGIGGPARLIKTGAGAVTLSVSNAYSGGTVVSEGTLTLSGNGRLSDTGPLIVSGGTFDIGTVSDTIGVVTLTGGNITGAGGVLSGACYKADIAVGTSMVSADLSGPGFLTKSGAGVLILSGSNSYSAATTINAGVLSVSSLANGGSRSGIGASPETAANLVLGGGSLQYTGGTVSINRGFTLAPGTISTIDVSLIGTTLTVSGTGAGTSGGLTKAGAGTLVLSGDNPYWGGTVISSGTLQIGNGGTTGSAGSGTIVNNASLAISRSDRVYTNVVPITGAGRLIKEGTNTLLLAGPVSYTGDTVVRGGVLSITNTCLPGSGSVYLTNSAKLNLNFTGVNIIRGLYFEGQAQRQGVWGSSISGALYTNNTYFSGVGTVLVTRGPPPDGTSFIVR